MNFFCPLELAYESNVIIEGGFDWANVDLENVGISYVANVGNAASERAKELLDSNDDRRNAVVPRNFTESDLPGSKMLQKVVYFGFIERPVCS